LSSKLDLDEKQTYELVDLYFSRNSHIYYNLNKQEEQIKNYQQSISGAPQPVVPGSQDMRIITLQKYNDELKSALKNLIPSVIELYYEERIAILRVVVELGIAATFVGHPLQKVASDCIHTLIETKDYLNVMWKLYYEYETKPSGNTKFSLEEREQFSKQLITEEFTILQIFFILYYKLQTIKPDAYIKMLEYFNKVQFQGGVSRSYKYTSEPHIASYTEEINNIVRKIIDISVLICLECLNLSQCLGSSSLSYFFSI